MAHLLRSILYPSEGHPHHLTTPPKAASFSASNHGRPRRSEDAPASTGDGGPVLQGFRAHYSNPKVIFTQDPEVEEPAASIVADSILGGFDLNQQLTGDNCDIDSTVNGNAAFVPGPESAAFVSGLESAASGNAAEEAADEISSQPVVPYVGMVFDDLEETYKVNNDYAYKTGFGIRIGNTKYSTSRNVPKDTILNRVFECVHTGKNAAATQGTRNRKDDAAKVLDSTVDMSSFTAEKLAKDKGMQMDLSDTRQRNRLLRYDCKAHMHVGKRNVAWIVIVFTEEHTHPMVKQLGRRNYYRSHRKVPEEDFQLLQTLHNQNITTAQIMGCIGNVRGGDLRTLGYVKRDVSNIRTMLRDDVLLRDMSLTIEYFEKRKAESPSFFYATQLDENNVVDDGDESSDA
ncbi:hypothetical protein ACQ4PT_024824 [Festuca glaucescens]